MTRSSTIQICEESNDRRPLEGNVNITPRCVFLIQRRRYSEGALNSGFLINNWDTLFEICLLKSIDTRFCYSLVDSQGLLVPRTLQI